MSQLLNGCACDWQPAHQLTPLPYAATERRCAELQASYRRIALFGGVYNNHLALNALLEDISRRDVELAICLGDLGGFGPCPQRIVPFLQQAGIPTIAGNYDISVAQNADDCGCGYTDPMDNYYAQISYAYTLANTPPDHRTWMSRLPLQARIRLGSYTVHCCHGSPRRTNEFLWQSGTSDAVLSRFLDDCRADVLAFTHTGIHWQRTVKCNDRTGDAVNVGVIGRPANDGENHVWYTLLSAEPALSIEFVPLRYDHHQLAAEMRHECLPEKFVETVLTGWWTTCLEALPAKERAQGRF